VGIKAWSDEEENKLKMIYTTETQDVYIIATKFEKGYRSVISKLVNMGIYIKPNTDKKNDRTVKTMLRDLEEILNIRIEGFNLNKKSNLEILVIALERKLEIDRE